MTSHVFYRYGLIASLAPALAFAQPSALRVVARTPVLRVEPDGSLRGERGAVELRWSTDVLSGDLVTRRPDTLRHEAATGLR